MYANVAHEVSAREMGQDQVIKGVQIEEEEVKSPHL